MTRNKWIFIGAFVLVDIILIYSLLLKNPQDPTSHHETSSSAETSSESTDTTAQPSADENPLPSHSELSALSQNEFYSKTQSFLESLPPIQEIQKLKKHAVHPKIIEGYQTIGKISDAAIQNNDLAEIALSTLESCANLEGYQPSIRAMCLKHHRLIRAAHQDDSYNESNRIKNYDQLNKLLREIPN